MRRTLILRRETLTALSPDDLVQVGAAQGDTAFTNVVCPLTSRPLDCLLYYVLSLVCSRAGGGPA